MMVIGFLMEFFARFYWPCNLKTSSLFPECLVAVGVFPERHFLVESLLVAPSGYQYVDVGDG